MKMHADEIDIDDALVRRLLRDQFPEWADLPLRPVVPAGTDNAIYRLGDDLVVRLTRIEWTAGHVDKEYEWVPKLAPHLPLELPVPLARGEHGQGYPWRWSVCAWLDGETALVDRIGDPHQAAIDLAAFITALRGIDPTGGPVPGGRGGPLAQRDEPMRDAIAALRDELDTDAVTALWEEALAASVWSGPSVWIHGDLDPRNMLARDGRLSGVIDFGCLAVGDPACDVMAAWKLLPATERDVFRTALSVDEATWTRARGWVLSQALIALAYYTRETNDVLVLEARRWQGEVLG